MLVFHGKSFKKKTFYNVHICTFNTYVQQASLYIKMHLHIYYNYYKTLRRNKILFRNCPTCRKRQQPTTAVSSTFEGALLTHQFSNGGRSKHVNSIHHICNPSHQFCINNPDAHLFTFTPKMCVNIGSFVVAGRVGGYWLGGTANSSFGWKQKLKPLNYTHHYIGIEP